MPYTTKVVVKAGTRLFNIVDNAPDPNDEGTVLLQDTDAELVVIGRGVWFAEINGTLKAFTS